MHWQQGANLITEIPLAQRAFKVTQEGEQLIKRLVGGCLCHKLPRARSRMRHKEGVDRRRQMLRHKRRDRVADLSRNLDFASLEDEIVGEGLQACRFAVGDGPMLLGVKIPSLLRFEELGTDRN